MAYLEVGQTLGSRLRRPNEACPRSSKASQALATTREEVASHSSQSQAFVLFTENSADRLRTLLTVKEVAAYRRVSTATDLRALCARRTGARSRAQHHPGTTIGRPGASA